MAHKFSKDELMQYKIRGQTKPFIDENLQLQIPLPENQGSVQGQYCALYSHYSHAGHNPAIIQDKYNVERAMSEARQSYETWKKMQEKIQQATTGDSDISMHLN
jgi:hypothetical protein